MTEDFETELFEDLAKRGRRALLAAAPVVLFYDLLYSVLEHWEPAPLGFAILRHGLAFLTVVFAMVGANAARPHVPYWLAVAFSFVALAYTLASIALSGGLQSRELPFYFVSLCTMPQVVPLRHAGRWLVFGVWFVCFAVFLFLVSPGGDHVGLLRVALVAAITAGAASWVQLRTYADAVRMRRTLREESARAALDAERRRLARDLHDHIGARLTGIALRSERELSRLGPDGAAALGLIQDSMAGCITELRDTVWALSERGWTGPELLSRMLRHAEDICSSAGVEVSFSIEPIEDELSPTVSNALLGITREALSNSVRHGGAKHARVTVGRRGSELEVSIEDDGAWREGERSDGHGLDNMAARARSAGGDLEVERRENATVLRVRLSLAAS